MNAHVLGNAVINVTANTKGLTDALSETRKQMSGFLTLANGIGGRFGGAIGSLYGMLMHGKGGGLGAVSNAMNAAIAGGATKQQAIKAAAGAAVPAGQSAVAIAGLIGSLENLTTKLKGAAEAASDYQEAVAKSEQTFGSNKGVIGSQAESLANKYGISRTETHGLSASAGLLLQSSGVSQEDSAKMGANLAKLAAEASSFYNVDVDEAMRRIQSGLSGMARPLREFGVMLTDAKVKAKAFEMGIVGVDGVVTDAAKTVARYALITEGLSRAEGDIERSQGRYAMQIRMLQGNLENLASTIGEYVLPYFTLMTSALNGLIQTTDQFLQGVRRVGTMIGTDIGAAIFGAQLPENFDRNAEVPDAGLAEIDARNQGLIDDALKLSAEEAAMKGRKHGAQYTDLQGLNRQIQEAISGGPAALMRDQVEIQKKSLEIQKQIAKGIANLKKPGLAADNGVPF